jgi:hypothetical protein
MKLALSAACLAVCLAVASHAFADGRTEATLQQPVAKKIEFTTDIAVWDCEGTSCVATYTPDSSFSIGECHEVARKVGDVAAFKDQDDHNLQGSALDRCNAGLAPKSETASR